MRWGAHHRCTLRCKGGQDKRTCRCHILAAKRRCHLIRRLTTTVSPQGEADCRGRKRRSIIKRICVVSNYNKFVQFVLFLTLVQIVVFGIQRESEKVLIPKNRSPAPVFTFRIFSKNITHCNFHLVPESHPRKETLSHGKRPFCSLPLRPDAPGQSDVQPAGLAQCPGQRRPGGASH